MKYEQIVLVNKSEFTSEVLTHNITLTVSIVIRVESSFFLGRRKIVETEIHKVEKLK